jgi:hypothetical protein
LQGGPQGYSLVIDRFILDRSAIEGCILPHPPGLSRSFPFLRFHFSASGTRVAPALLGLFSFDWSAVYRRNRFVEHSGLDYTATIFCVKGFGRPNMILSNICPNRELSPRPGVCVSGPVLGFILMINVV